MVGVQVPNIEHVAKEFFVEGFQIAIGALAGVLLVALFLASFIPKILVDEVKSEEIREAMADVSNGRLDANEVLAEWVQKLLAAAHRAPQKMKKK